MGRLGTSNRTKMIAAGLCLAGMFSVCLTTSATAQSLSAAGIERPVQPKISSLRLTPRSWRSIAAPEFRAFSRQYFYVRTDDNRPVRLRLLMTIEVDSGPHRPKTLPRRESLIAVFNASKADRDWFIKHGHQSVNIWHHALGNDRVFIGAVKNARGQYKIEMVLN